MSIKIHLGCGDNFLEGWENLDIEPRDWAKKADLTRNLMYSPESVGFVYTEHFVEHIERDQAVNLFANCYAAIQWGGVMRISTPAVDTLLKKYFEKDVGYYSQLKWYPQSPCRMLNEGMRSWGHKFMWDYEELSTCLIDIGFLVYRVEWGRSKYEALKNIESRPSLGDLIVEAVKKR